MKKTMNEIVDQFCVIWTSFAFCEKGAISNDIEPFGNKSNDQGPSAITTIEEKSKNTKGSQLAERTLSM